MEIPDQSNCKNRTLLIHADPGARSGFVAAWLTNKLGGNSFDVGVEDKPSFYKVHILGDDRKTVLNFPGVKIRIRPTYKKIDLHCLLFLRKNIHVQDPDFTKDEYSLDTLSKLWSVMTECFEQDSALDLNMYDYTINFEDTYCTTTMVALYKKVNKQEPTEQQINALQSTNHVNTIHIDKNHSTTILKLCFEKEALLKLKESERFWSIIDVYNTTPVDKLYDTVLEKIKPENYGILLDDTTTY